MTPLHDDRHRTWLDQWQAEGHLAEASRTELLACPECADEARAVVEIEGRLRGLGDAERNRVLERADGRLDAPGEAGAQAALRAAMEGRGARRRFDWLPAALIAAALLVVFFLVREGEPKDDGVTPSILLEGDGVRLGAPLGEVELYGRFEWATSVAVVRYHELRVWDADPPGRQVLVEQLDDDELSWTPTPDEEADLPERIRWQVVALDATGEEVGASPVQEASRSSP